MNEDLQDKIVYCDGGWYDQQWNFVLFDAADMKPNFVISHYQPVGLIDLKDLLKAGII